MQFLRAPLPCGVDEGDLPWEIVTGYVDFTTDEVEAWSAAAEYDSAFDYMYVHRIVATPVANDTTEAE